MEDLQIILEIINNAFHSNIHEKDLHLERLKSKKNTVLKIHFNQPIMLEEQHLELNDIIIKLYPDSKTADLEQENIILEKARKKNILVPPVILKKENFLILSNVEGKNLCDFINDDGVSISLKEEAVERLGQWLATFHHGLKDNEGNFTIRGDATLRNFIYNNSQIIGIDFEESDIGDPIIDACNIVDSMLITHPGIYTMNIDAIPWKFDLCRLFLDEYLEKRKSLGYLDFLGLTDFVEYLLPFMGRLAMRRGKINDFLRIERKLKETLMQELRPVFILT
ncbi:MAG: hypothetical protein ACTSVI_03090 [Promethearchaeota archaeon]